MIVVVFIMYRTQILLSGILKATVSIKKKSAFTLIEVMIVTSIIMILASIIVAGVRGARTKAFRLQCLSNVKTLGQVTLLYSDDNVAGRLPDSFSVLYDPVDFNDLSVYICPTQRNKDLNISAFPYTFTDKTNISYNFVNDSSTAPAVPQATSYPLTNIIIIENLSTSDVFDGSTNHNAKGGSAFMISGKATFVGKNHKGLKNLCVDGVHSYQIKNSESLYK